MKLVIQRVTQASVEIAGESVGKIGKGYMVLFGAGAGDTKEIADKLFDKMIKLRIFQDEDGKTNKSIADVGGELLIVSQFTLYANCKKGNRPSFMDAGKPQEAEELYEYFLTLAKEKYGSCQHGEFGADMQVSLCNDGPFTIILDSETL
ncbi:d-tyrosyl-tRNA(Tyr) deacylase [Clostridium sp. CAG:411]|jgi:D-tyrosyl-tRNA(Tyr) deacylase|nr:d-tyrosyl-tRNA(Tyr) deacylase [Clostridium sp. CAG:411]